jgi:hypothetical protein
MNCSFTRLLALAVLFTAFAANALAQGTPTKNDAAPPPNPCPQLEFRAPQQRIVKDGENISFSIVLTGGDPAITPAIVWSTSAGTIQSGQGTRNVRIDTTGSGNDRQIRTDVWIGGYSPECSLQGSSTLQIAGPATKFVEFGEVSADDENGNLRSFAGLVMESSDNAYVFGYAGRNSARGFTNLTLKRIKAQLIANGIPYERLALIDGGFREHPSIELWIVPVGADAPKAKPTVNAKDIVFPKTAPVKKP